MHLYLHFVFDLDMFVKIRQHEILRRAMFTFIMVLVDLDMMCHGLNGVIDLGASRTGIIIMCLVVVIEMFQIHILTFTDGAQIDVGIHTILVLVAGQFP